MTRVFIIVILSSILTVAGSSFAQQVHQNSEAYAYDFKPREQVIFEDNFSQDAVKTFPSKWRKLGTDPLMPAKHCQVQKDGGNNVLATSDIISDIEPDIDADLYLTDSFTLEYDFMLGKDSINTVDIDFRAKHNAPASFDWFTIAGNGIASYVNLNTGDKQLAAYPGKFGSIAWHHLAIAYENGTFDLYVDQYHLLKVPSYYGFPMFSFGMHCRPQGKVKNVRLATGKKNNSLNETITEKGIANHSATSLKVFPNPEQKSFTINISSAIKENALITVTNMVGDKIKEFMTITNTDKEIQLDSPPGIYCISAVTRDKTMTAKVMLE